MVGLSWCVPPIKWLQRWVVPPEGAEDWQRVSFQPMLYLATWIATWVILIAGDFASIPETFRDEAAKTQVLWSWGALGLLSPVIGIGSLRMITHGTGRWRYRGLWMRLGADVGQFAAMVIYLVLRIAVGDYHVYPVACLASCGVFVMHLCFRDIRRLHEVESLAAKIRRGEVTRRAH